MYSVSQWRVVPYHNSRCNWEMETSRKTEQFINYIYLSWGKIQELISIGICKIMKRIAENREWWKRKLNCVNKLNNSWKKDGMLFFFLWVLWIYVFHFVIKVIAIIDLPNAY